MDKFLEVDKKVRQLQQEIDEIRAAKKSIGKDEAQKGRELKEKVQALEKDFTIAQQERFTLLRRMPNIAFEDVPVGKTDAENVVLRQVGKLPKFDFAPKEHWQLGQELDIIEKENNESKK